MFEEQQTAFLEDVRCLWWCSEGRSGLETWRYGCLDISRVVMIDKCQVRMPSPGVHSEEKR